MEEGMVALNMLAEDSVAASLVSEAKLEQLIAPIVPIDGSGNSSAIPLIAQIAESAMGLDSQGMLLTPNSAEKKRKRGRPRKSMENGNLDEEDYDFKRHDWDLMVELLKQYQDHFGHTNVPTTYGALGEWVNIMRNLHKKGKLPEEKVMQLNEAGFSWARHGDWDEMYEQLKLFKMKHGHCNVPQRSAGRLGYWVNNMRQYYKKSKLSEERIRKLDELGFVWQQYSVTSWDVMFDELKKWRDEKGNCNVPQKSGKLGQWVNEMRSQNREGKLNPERKRKLEEIGFTWNTKAREHHTPIVKATWEKYYEDLKQFREINSHCNVRRRDGRLGGWVHDQRQAFKKRKLSEDKIEKLNELGFTWSMVGNTHIETVPVVEPVVVEEEEDETAEDLRVIGAIAAMIPAVASALDFEESEEEDEDEDELDSEVERELMEELMTPEEAEQTIQHIKGVAQFMSTASGFFGLAELATSSNLNNMSVHNLVNPTVESPATHLHSISSEHPGIINVTEEDNNHYLSMQTVAETVLASGSISQSQQL